MSLDGIVILVMVVFGVWMMGGFAISDIMGATEDRELGIIFFWPILLVVRWIPLGIYYTLKYTFIGVSKLRVPRFRHYLVRTVQIFKAAL